jgi:hypothetical protein
MRKSNERSIDSGIYARLRNVRMSASDRQQAVDTLRQAELLVDAFLWVKEKVAACGNYFLKPALRH